MNSRKGFVSLSILTLIVVGLAVAGVAYVVLGNNPSSQSSLEEPLPLLTFTTPQSGAQINAVQGAKIQWKFADPSITQTFPNKETYVVLSIIDANEQGIGSIGDGHVISGTSASWNIISNLNQEFYTLKSGAQYKIRATLSYEPQKFTCDPAVKGECNPVYSVADQALRDAAAKYQSESGWFTVDLEGYIQPVSNANSTTISLKSNGLGVVNFGASSEQVIPQLSTLLGVPSKDTGWIDGFSTYGTCPSDKIRVVEWNRLRVFFGDTAFGTQKFFQWEYTGRDTTVQAPALATDQGVTLGMSKSQVQSLYPQAQIRPWIENYESMHLVPYNNSTHEYLGGSLQNGTVFWISGGLQCGE